MHVAAELAWGASKRPGKAARKIELIREPTPGRNLLDGTVGARQHGDGELELHQAAHPHGRKAQFLVEDPA